MSKSSKQMLALTKGIFSTVTNTMLFCLFWVGASAGKSGSYGAYMAFEEALKDVEKVNYDSVKRSFFYLKKIGLVKADASFTEDGEIYMTENGYQRIKNLLPRYRKIRPWNKRLYLVTYDIPETKRVIRDRLRKFLLSISCAKLQKSLWVTPYDPRRQIMSFIKIRPHSSSLIISEFGKKNSIGGEDIKSFSHRVFHISKVNRQYRQFLRRISKNKKIDARDYLLYLSILANDPQLPRELLSNSWLGDDAYDLVSKYCSVRIPVYK